MAKNMPAYFTIAIPFPDEGVIRHWDGVFNQEELEVRIASAINLPDGYAIYELKHRKHQTRKGTITKVVDEIVFL